jgi:hypothetical protein
VNRGLGTREDARELIECDPEWVLREFSEHGDHAVGTD